MLAITDNIQDNRGMTEVSSPEIRAWYIPRVLPIGGAPDHIKKGWLDVPLPLRYDLSDEPTPVLTLDAGYRGLEMLDNTVTVTADDATKSLRIFQRGEALDWWCEYFLTRPQPLAFQIQEGDEVVQDSSLRQIMPGLGWYDQPPMINFDPARIETTGRHLEDVFEQAVEARAIDAPTTYGSYRDGLEPPARAAVARGIVEAAILAQLDTSDPSTLAALVELAMWKGEQAVPRTSQPLFGR